MKDVYQKETWQPILLKKWKIFQIKKKKEKDACLVDNSRS